VTRSLQSSGLSIDDDSVYFVAEAGVNHNGDLDRARALIDAASDAGADAVKFQTFATDRLVADDTATATYQAEAVGESESQAEMLDRYELDRADHDHLREYCRETGITFLSTPFDRESADLLDDLGVEAIKIGSGELTNLTLLRHVASLGRPTILSTGMATMDEVEAAYDAIRDANPGVALALLHCTSAYPTDLSDVNLRAMQSMAETFPVPVGYSDHTMSVETPGFAVAAGASIVEKHLTLDRSLPGPDHEASLEPGELDRAVSVARDAATARGSPEKRPVDAERETRALSRKSLHAAKAIEAGERLTRDAITILRPADGLPPSEVDATVGRIAAVDVPESAPITADVLEAEEPE